MNIAKCSAVLLLALLVMRRERRKDRTETENTKEITGKAPAADTTAGATIEDRKRTGMDVSRQLQMYWNASLIGLGLYVFGWFIPEVSRICYYLTFTQVFYIPMLLRRLSGDEKGVRLRRILTGLVILAGITYFALFLKTAYRDTIKILPYKSFLFHELNQTPSGSVG